MKKTTASLIVCAGLLLAAALTPVRAQDKEADQVVVRGRVTAGAQAVGESVRSSKFTEYRDVPKGPPAKR